MACGVKRSVLEWSVSTCWVNVPYPCGFVWCSVRLRYPCGVKWCKKWGVRYPCGVKTCSKRIRIACGIRFCRVRVPYPCLIRKLVEKYCYDFSVVHDNCKVLYEKHYGCCDGVEYAWSDACLGWFGIYQSRNTRCFDEPLEGKGPCRTGGSLPSGGEIPGGSLDPGSVAPHPANDPTRRLRDAASDPDRGLRRIGGCKKCALSAVLLSITAWTLVLLASLVDVIWVVPFKILAGMSSALAVAHIAAALLRKRRPRGTRPVPEASP